MRFYDCPETGATQLVEVEDMQDFYTAFLRIVQIHQGVHSISKYLAATSYLNNFDMSEDRVTLYTESYSCGDTDSHEYDVLFSEIALPLPPKEVAKIVVARIEKETADRLEAERLEAIRKKQEAVEKKRLEEEEKAANTEKRERELLAHLKEKYEPTSGAPE